MCSWICFFDFHENDINILISAAMNLYLALGSIEMSTVLNLQSMSMICYFKSSFLDSLSQCGRVVFSVLVLSL